MTDGVLVSAQLSNIYQHTTVIPIETKQAQTPLAKAPEEAEIPLEHAQYASVFHSSQTGTILLRVIQAGLVIELISLSKDIKPIQFAFPSPVLSKPALFLWEPSELLHVLAVTSSGSLFKISLPASEGLWQDQLARHWQTEHVIRNACDGLVHVQGPHSVAIASTNGTLLRLDATITGEDVGDGAFICFSELALNANHRVTETWNETLQSSSSLLNSLVTFLPLHQHNANAESIISIATHPQPTDIDTIWTISRSRNLKLWTLKGGCIASTTLTPPSKSLVVAGQPAPVSLLGPDYQNLIRVVPSDNAPVVIAFIPSSTQSQSGASFQLIKSQGSHLKIVKTILCSELGVGYNVQDFIAIQDTLFVLWDADGQSVIAQTSLTGNETEWTITRYPQGGSELSPAYLEDLLLDPGSMSSIFLSAIIRPGVFSAYTLKTAIEQYIAHYREFPDEQPAALTATYPNVTERIAAVVGSTVRLHRDPTTGAFEHSKYTAALKRDWEGFVARCREIERSAARPVALGFGEHDKIVLVERERVALVAPEDATTQVHRQLSEGDRLSPGLTALEVAWNVRKRMAVDALAALESRYTLLLQEDTDSSYIQLLEEDVAENQYFSEDDADFANWVYGRLESAGGYQKGIQQVLESIFELEHAIKDEDIAANFQDLNAPPLALTIAQVASYATSSISSRYELCLALLSLMVFLTTFPPTIATDDNRTPAPLLNLPWDPVIVEEALATFRSLILLRDTSRRSGTLHPQLAATRTRSFEDGDVSYSPTYSVLYTLVSQSGAQQSFIAAVHQFLASTGLFAAEGASRAIAQEVLWCERLRALGFTNAASEALSYFPKTPAVSYISALLALEGARPEVAVIHFDKIAGSFGEGGLTNETGSDGEALSSLLPVAENQLFASDFEFYIHVASLLRKASYLSYEVAFAQKALSECPIEPAHLELWTPVIRGYIELGQYDDAYASLVACPYADVKREYASELVYRMCEDNATERLIGFSFPGFVDDVEHALGFKSRNSDPLAAPYYSHIMYSWFISRSDYRNAALTMYLRARKLHDIIGDTHTVVQLAEQQLESFLIAINALQMLGKGSAWFVIPLVTETGNESRKRRRLTKNMPDERFAIGKQDSEVVQLSDIQYEYALLSARFEMYQADKLVGAAGADFFLPAESMVLRLTQRNQFNKAMATARSLNVDMTDLFGQLTLQCVKLTKNAQSVLQNDNSDWLLTEGVSSWPGTPADRSWRYLRVSLSRHDGPENDFAYSKAVFETLVSLGDATPPPSWLISTLETHHPEYLIRTNLKYELLEPALESAIALVQKADLDLTSGSYVAATTWLPYTLLDQILATSVSEPKATKRAQELRQQLQTIIGTRVKRLSKTTATSRLL